MSERILRVVKDTTPEKSPYQEYFDEGFKEGYARGSQQATEYYSREILSLHAQILKLQQERSGNDQPPRLFVSLLDRLNNTTSPRLVEHDLIEPDPDKEEFFN